MKKLFAVFCILSVLVTLTACGGKNDAQAGDQEETVIKLGVVGEANEAWQPVV